MREAIFRATQLSHGAAIRRDVTRVENWLQRHSERVGAAPMFWPALWRVSDDTDGSVLLVPLCDTDPGIAIIPSVTGYEVLICDPDDMDEIGPFDTIEDSLDGIVAWFELPCRSIELKPERHPRLSRLQ